MTWYEALEEEEGLPGGHQPQQHHQFYPQRAPMAAHLLRWWRTKLSAGYKHLSVLGDGGERTDTEELVGGRAPSQCSAPPDLLPSEARALLASAATTPPSSPCAARAAPPTTPHGNHHHHQHNLLQHQQPLQHQTEPVPSTPPPVEPAHGDRLHFEEFTCDVRVKGGAPTTAGGSQPLHFSFTLYDFDGHGRITKDDIAGIVSTIYESFGKNVKVPHYGSKTIQVRLTVSPDQQKISSDNETPRDALASSSISRDHKVRFKRDLGNHHHLRDGRRRLPRKRLPETIPLVAQSQEEEIQLPSSQVERTILEVEPNEDGRRSRLSIDDDVSECSERIRTPKSCKRTLRQRQYQKNNLSPRFRNQQNNLNHHRNDIWNCQKENVLPVSNSESPSGPKDVMSSADGSRTRTHSDKTRSGSKQRRELLEIIQANMEKNHLSFQTARKQYPEHKIITGLENECINNNKNRHRGRSNTFSSKHTSEPIARTNFDHVNNGYLDLASPNANAHKESNICRYDSYLHAVICSSSHQTKTSGHIKAQTPLTLQAAAKPWKSHHRSRSHDLAQGPFRYTLLEPYESLANAEQQQPQEILKNIELRAKSSEYCKEQEVMHRLNIITDAKSKSHLYRSESAKPKFHDGEQIAEGLRKSNSSRKQQTVHNHACSPHHLKHQNREKYHARAMAQVEKWLENDNNTRLAKNNNKKKWLEQDCKMDNLTANLDINDSLEWKGLLRGSEVDGDGEESNNTNSTVHRYVHEHIHHHYHHFEDKLPTTNAVVV